MLREINAATKAFDDTVTYFYDAVDEVFLNGDIHRATHAVHIDKGLTAQEIDVILNEVLF